MNPGSERNPVLFLVFNRPVETARSFRQIRAARPPRLYVAADGPRNETEQEKCDECRRLAVEHVDWECEVKTRFLDRNAGCKLAVSSAITWFFSDEEQGVIVEDDCVPSLSFFDYCDELLHYYRTDSRVMMISGDNFQGGIRRGRASYYFSRFPHIWGWASWRRAWNHYDVAMRDLEQFVSECDSLDCFPTTSERDYWLANWRRVADGGLDTWDYQWVFAIMRNGGLCAVPNANLVSNVGFDENATHTTTPDPLVAELEARDLVEITHPRFVIANRDADQFEMARHSSVPKASSRNSPWLRRAARKLLGPAFGKR